MPNTQPFSIGTHPLTLEFHLDLNSVLSNFLQCLLDSIHRKLPYFERQLTYLKFFVLLKIMSEHSLGPTNLFNFYTPLDICS